MYGIVTPLYLASHNSHFTHSTTALVYHLVVVVAAPENNLPWSEMARRQCSLWGSHARVHLHVCVCVCECVYCCARSKGLLISRYIHYKASAYCRTCGAGHCNRRGGPLRQLTLQREIERERARWRAKYDTHTHVLAGGQLFFFVFAHLCCADRAASTATTTTEHGIGSVRPEIMAVHFLLEPSSPLRGFRFARRSRGLGGGG